MALDVLGDAPPGLEIDDAHAAAPVRAVLVLSPVVSQVLEPVDAPGDPDGDDAKPGGGYPVPGPVSELGAEDLHRDVDVGANGLLDVGADVQGVAFAEVGVESLDHGAGAVSGQAPQPGVGVAEVIQALLEGLPQGGAAQVLALRPFSDLVDEAAQGLGVAGGGRTAVAAQEPPERAGGQALDVGGAHLDPLPLRDERGGGGGTCRTDPGGGVGPGHVLAGEIGQQLDGGSAAPVFGGGGRLQVSGDGRTAQFPDQAAQGEVSGIRGEDRGAVGVGQVDPGGLGDLCQER